MIYPDYIISIENKHIKYIKKILASPKDFPQFLIVEGDKHSKEFINSINFRLMRWFVVEGRQYDFPWIDNNDITIISSSVLNHLTDLEASKGIIGLFSCSYKLLDQNCIDFQETFILDKISDPGNLGTIIRTAVALGRKNLILVEGVFPFSSKVVRASAGMIAHIRIFRFTLNQILKVLFLQPEIKLLKMEMGAERICLKNIDQLYNHFILLGSEGDGVRKNFDQFTSKSVALPMSDKVESLNVGVAGSVVGYLTWGGLE